MIVQNSFPLLNQHIHRNKSDFSKGLIIFLFFCLLSTPTPFASVAVASVSGSVFHFMSIQLNTSNKLNTKHVARTHLQIVVILTYVFLFIFKNDVSYIKNTKIKSISRRIFTIHPSNFSKRDFTYRYILTASFSITPLFIFGKFDG